jgi:putative two-component system response regulator
MEAQRPGDILIVEDDPAFLSAACLTLTRARHGVVSCSSSEEARNHLERIPFDVVLISQTLPDGDGEALCRSVKSNSSLHGLSAALLVDPAAASTAPDQLFGELQAGYNIADFVADDTIRKDISPQELVLRVRTLLRLRRYSEEIQNAVATIMTFAEGAEEQDKRAKGHCKRLATMAIELGSLLRLDDWSLTVLERAGFLHDIGKIRIPGALLEKVQPLSPREMEIIQSHCTIGERMCRSIAALEPSLKVIRHHHERLDGSGYPDGLRGEQIPILVQVFSVVDVYESLRTWRPYRPPLTEAHAIQVLQQEVDRGFWNRKIFDLFKTQVLPGLDGRLKIQDIHWPRESEGEN